MYNRKLVFWAACLGMLLFGMVMISLGSINNFLAVKFQLDNGTIASLAALLPLGILLGSLVFGPIVDRYSYKMLLVVCGLLIIIGIEGIAFAPSFGLIKFFFFLIGFGGGAINGGTNALVADISSEDKGANLSLLGSFYGLGALGMPLVLGLMSSYFKIEQILGVIGLIVLMPVLFFCFVRFPKPKQVQGMPLKQGLGLIKDASLLMLGLILFFESGVEGVVNNWTTLYLSDPNGSVHMTPANALYCLTFLVLSLTVTRLFLGGLLKKFPSYKVLIGCLFIALLGVVSMYLTRNMGMAIVSLVLLGAGFAATFPVVLGYAGELFPNLSGTAISICFTIALIGNTIINYVVGIIGVKYYVLLVALCLVLMLFMISRTIGRIRGRVKI